MKQNYKAFFFILFGILFINADKKYNNVFKLKNIEKSLCKITGSLYASKFEVTNFQYKVFLNDLKHAGEEKKYKIAAIDTSKWLKVLLNDTICIKYYHSDVKYDNYPIVNISKEAALLFCEWLTEKYNSYPKRKFTKVLFRLPTEYEWKKAARGTSESAIFPWSGFYMRNTKGQFLANFRPIHQYQVYYDTDMGELKIKNLNFIKNNTPIAIIPTAPVDLFWPNEYELYNMSGNVAEMIVEKGRTKGGSWASTGYYLQINAEDEYEGFSEPSPMIGFRYFMEVIEI